MYKPNNRINSKMNSKMNNKINNKINNKANNETSNKTNSPPRRLSLDELRIAALKNNTEKEYWRKQMEGDPVAVHFPFTKNPGENQQTRNMETDTFRQTGRLMDRLLQLSNHNERILFMIELAAIKALLKRYNNATDDIIVGTPILKQEKEGQYINTVLPLRDRLQSSMTFKELLKQIRKTVQEANKYQNYPVRLLVKDLQMHYGNSDFPLFQVAAQQENIHEPHAVDHIPVSMRFTFKKETARIEGKLEYDAHRYTKSSIQRILTHYSHFLEDALKDIEKPLKDIEIFSEQEKQQLLIDFNDIGGPFPEDHTIHGLFEAQVKNTPDTTALVTPENQHISYRELNRQAEKEAAVLKNEGLRPGDIAAIKMKRSIRMITGILGILKTGAAYLPLNPKAPDTRNRFQLADSNAKLLLTEDGILRQPAAAKPNPLSLPESATAYIIYTSGSTGNPKGVPITHSNFSPLIHWGYRETGIGKGDRVIQNSSYYFDWSVWEIFITLTTGATLYTITEEMQLTPSAQIRYIRRQAVTALHVTPTQYRYHLNHLSHLNHLGEIQRQDTLKYLFIGGEKLSEELVRQCLQSVPGACRVFNMYGPTEATIISTTFEIHRRQLDEYRNYSSVPIGKTVGNSHLLVLDENDKLTPIDAEGELYIAGPALADGYLNNPALTAAQFTTTPLSHTSHHPHSQIDIDKMSHIDHMSDMSHPSYRLYKTGDRVRWLESGDLEFLGRIDNQVKIRGNRIEPGEIENTLLKQQNIRDAIVIARKNKNGENTLCAYIVPKHGQQEKWSVEQLRKQMSAELPDYMVPANIVPLERLPLNPNGKVDINALPEPGTRRGGAVYTAPRDRIEKKLTEIWADVLTIKEEKVGIDDNFFHLGGHSLKANHVTADIYRAYHVKLPLAEIFEKPTIRELAAAVKKAELATYTPLPPAEKKQYYPLTPAQRRLYILQQMELDATGYNMPTVIPLKEDVDPQRLETAVNQLIQRHESLRTSFRQVNDEPCQVIHETAGIKIQYHDLRSRTGDLEAAAAAFQTQWVKPFDLSRAPLIRAAIVRTGEKRHRLMVDMHHIITDGTSQKILTEELPALYRGEPLPPPGRQYKDYAQWQHTPENRRLQERQEAYWLQRLAGELPVLELPTDHPRPKVQSFEGRRIYFALDEDRTRKLRELADRNDATLYMTLLAVYNIQLSRLSNREDIIVGTPAAGRRHPDTRQMIGMLVNTLPMRNNPDGNKTPREFLAEIKRNTLEARENQDYPFDQLVEKLNVNRDTGRNPVFDVLFNYLDQADANHTRSLADTAENVEYENVTAKFDLNLTAVDRGQTLHFGLEYCTKLFKKETVERFIAIFKRITDAIINDPDQRLKEIEILNTEEKTEILNISEGKTEPLQDRTNRTIHRWFEATAAKHPHKTALVMHDKQLTYEQLDKDSNRMARTLRAAGVTADTVVALMMERSIEMITGIIAILKAGGAYLPIDPAYPDERKKHMLKDSRTPLIVTDGTPALPEISSDTAIIDISRKEIYDDGDTSLEPVSHSHNLLYVLYTSGSTGKPKGVMLEHRNLTNLMQYHYRHTGIDHGRVLQFTTISFDVSFQEIFSTLLAGGELHVITRETRDNIPEMFRLIDAHRIKTLFLATGFLKFVFTVDDYIDVFPTGIRHLVTAGEQLTVNRKLRAYLVANRVKLHNHYGPSEAHVVTALTMEPTAEIPHTPTIGSPVSNTGIYILNKYRRLQPIGQTGELYIGGTQVGRGYLNNPELTNQKFIKIHTQIHTQKHTQIHRQTHSQTHSQTQVENQIHNAYRTGDMARWQKNGELQFLGRTDHQVKIRGFRIELGEIENRLLENKQIKEAVAVVKQDKHNEKYICAYIVTQSQNTGETENHREWSRYLADRLPDYMVPSVFVTLKRLPLTPNGKVNRTQLPEPDPEHTRQHNTAPRTQLERRLADIWSGVLSIEPDRLGIDDNFFRLGGHSLKGTIVTARLHKLLNIKLPLSQLFQNPTIRQLAAAIRRSDIHDTQRHHTVEPVEKKEYYPLSSAQKRLYVLQQIEADNIAYNLPTEIQLVGELHREKIEEVFKRLIARHESFRTSFEQQNDEPVQVVHESVPFRLETGEPDQPLQMREFVRTFDLTAAPLLRVGLVRLAQQKHRLMVDMHHIITDGTSLEILTREIMAIYAGEELPPLKIQYRDYSQWQNSPAQKDALKKQAGYWQNQYQDEIPVIQLPADYPRPAITDNRGRAMRFQLTPGETSALRRQAEATGSTLYMVLLTIYTVLLAKLTGQEDIVVGTPVAGRTHDDLFPIIGMFVNTLALRNTPLGHQAYDTYREEVKERTLEAFENSDYPFEDLVESLDVTRDTGRNPLFDVMFSLQNVERNAIEIPGLTLVPVDYETKISKFDLTLHAVEKGDCLGLSFEYGTGLFKAETIERFIGYLKKTVGEVTQNAQQTISEIDIVPEPEKHRMLEEFNRTDRQIPGPHLIHRLFEEQVQRTPHRIAAIDQKQETTTAGATITTPQTVTYRQLNRQANRQAHRLIKSGVLPDQTVGIMVDRSIDMLIAILTVLKSGGAYVPLDPNYPADRIKYILEKSGTALLIVDHLQQERLAHLDYSGRIIDITETPSNKDTEETYADPARILEEHHLAYVIYTSGSTGNPKGVMLEHRNVVNFIHSMADRIEFAPEKTILAVTTISFDIFVLETLLPLAKGMRIVIANEDQTADPEQLENLILQDRIDMLQFTPSRLSLLLADRTDRTNRKCFSRVTEIMVGGEAFPQHVFRQLKQHYDGKIYNMYGPTETTVWSAVKELTGQETITVGTPVANTQVYILDRNQRLQPLGVVGELCIGGHGVARGYLNNPELTAAQFPPSLQSHQSHQSHRLYKTGDQARWLLNGEIEFLGRIDHQVKIRGFRIELQEIEECLRAHPAIKEAAVTVTGAEKNDKALCAYIVSERPVEPPELREHLSRTLPDYMLPSYYKELERMPLTPNGKIDRNSLPKLDAAEPAVSTGSTAPPRNRREMQLQQHMADILKINKEHIGIDANFFQLGGHSLKATTLLSAIQKTMAVKITLGQFFKIPTIEGLAGLITRSNRQHSEAVEPVENRRHYPQTSAQKRLYLLQQMEPENTGYNLTLKVRLEGPLNIDRLRDTFNALINRHESLRTSFHLENEEPVQKVHHHWHFDVEYHEIPEPPASGTPVETVSERFIRPFDLTVPPQIRVGLIKEAENTYVLLADVHHIVADGTSMAQLLHEFMELYAQRPLPPLRLQYKDYAHWQQNPEQKEALKKQEEYWLNRYNDDIPVIQLPTDHPRPAQQQFEGRTLRFALEKEETAALNRLAQAEGATLYMMLLANFAMILSRLTGQQDIVVGTPVAGRNHNDLQGIVGMFVNTLGIRTRPERHKTVARFLQQVKEHTLDALDNQDYPFEELVENVAVKRDTGRNPIFDVMFVMQNMEQPEIAIDGLKLKPYRHESLVSRFDMTFQAYENKGRLEYAVEYCTKLFETATIERFARYYRNMAAAIASAEGKELTIGEIDFIPGSEKRLLLETFNKTDREYPEDTTVHRRIEEQAEKTPDHIAAVFQASYEDTGNGKPQPPEAITYRELNCRAGQLAQRLKQKGAGIDTTVGIMINRSIEMLIGILGILKSGGAYVPLDPHYPAQRIEYILKRSGTALLLSGTTLSQAASPPTEIQNRLSAVNYNGEIIDISDPSIYAEEPGQKQGDIPSSALAYVIYTSGSTGNPKGVMLEHRNVVNFMHAMAERIEFTPQKTILGVTTISFDIFVLETLLPLAKGMRIVIADEEQAADPDQLEKLIVDNQIDMLQFTPSRLSLLLADRELRRCFNRVTEIMVGGEAFPQHVFRQLKQHYDGKIYNMYGPTETTVWSAVKELTGQETITVGTPVANTQVYILDNYRNLQPLGVAGELCIGGHGVARGYLNNPELTAAQFPPSHYSHYSHYSHSHMANKSHMPHMSDMLSHPSHQPHRFYKTGDRAHWLPNGEIEFQGRIDHQVKIRGFRVELEEIEERILSHSDIKEAAVKAIEDGSGSHYLCAYYSTAGTTKEPELKEHLSQTLPAYMIPSCYMKLDKIPLTPNGKIDRNALPAPDMNTETVIQPPRNQTEKQLAEIWEETLGIHKNKISIDADFFQLGGHSLKATIMLAKIHKQMNAKITMKEMFKTPTIKGLAQHIKRKAGDRYNAVEPAETKEYYELSSAQQRLFILTQLAQPNVVYNLPAAWLIEGEIDHEHMENTFRQLTTRHEILRTSFGLVEGKPYQFIHEQVNFKVDVLPAVKGDIDDIEDIDDTDDTDDINEHIRKSINRFVKPFDLTKAPQFRAAIMKLEPEKHLLLFDMHHIITDGYSLGILVKDFSTLYRGDRQPPLNIQYKDYSQWQTKGEGSRIQKLRETFWLNKFSDGAPQLELPLDNPRPPIQVFDGGYVTADIDTQLTEQLKQITKETETTTNILLLAVYFILLSRYTGQKDIVVGQGIAGRTHPDLEDLIGFFVNVLAIRNRLNYDDTFTDFLEELKENMLEAYENQDYPFDQLVGKLKISAEINRNPLCNVSFVVQNMELQQLQLGNSKIIPQQVERKSSRFDLQMEVTEIPNAIVIGLEYAAALFNESTIEKFAQRYIEILRQVVENKRIKLKDIVIQHDIVAVETSILQEEDMDFVF
jgi:tyrocidine synthetase III